MQHPLANKIYVVKSSSSGQSDGQFSFYSATPLNGHPSTLDTYNKSIRTIPNVPTVLTFTSILK